MKRIVFGLLACLSTSALAQQSIKPRPLGAVQATSKELLGSATLARQLPNGSVIVNDAAKRRLLLLDPTLQGFAVIADSTSGAANGYGQRPGALLPYVADSTLYLDVTAGSFLVIDQNGKVARVMSPPRPSDNNFLTNTNFGFPGFDAQGRMIYRASYPRQLLQTRDGGISSSPAPDSAPIIRVNLDTRKADTIGVVKLAKTLAVTTTMPGGGVMTMNTQAPLQSIDDWALLSDGSVAVLRGRDYHIDWVNADGTKKTTDRIAFEWQRLNDDQKLAIIDSISKARASMQSAPGGGAPMMMFGDGGGMSVMYRGSDGGGGGGGRGANIDRAMVASAAATAVLGTPPAATPAAPAKAADSTAKATPADPKSPAAAAASSTGNSGNSNAGVTPAGSPADKVVAPDKAMTEGKAAGMAGMAGMPGMPGMPGGMPALPLPAASDLPDYMPPFMNSSARPDADAHVWVRTTTPGATVGNVVYDVINNKGELIDRVDVPKGMSIVGFGKGGIVYLTQREAYSYRLIKATIH